MSVATNVGQKYTIEVGDVEYEFKKLSARQFMEVMDMVEGMETGTGSQAITKMAEALNVSHVAGDEELLDIMTSEQVVELFEKMVEDNSLSQDDAKK